MKSFLLVFSFFIHVSIYADEIHLRTDLWCPYACDPKSDHPGFMVEIANEVFSKSGHTVKYDLLNWARVLNDVKKGTYDAVVGASRSDVEGFVIPKLPLGKNLNYFYSKKNSLWTFNGVQSLKGKKIGVINDYSYGDELDKIVQSNHPSIVKISGDKPLERMIQMLEAGRLDAIVENTYVFQMTMTKNKKSISDFKIISKNISNDTDLFIAFTPSKSSSQKFAKLLDEGIVKLRNSGKLKEILNRYGLEDWK